MKIYSTLTALALASLISSCQSGPGASSTDNVHEIAPAQVNKKIANAKNQNAFAAAAAAGSLMEIEASARMIKHTEDGDVQDLATMLINEHLKAQRHLTAIAQQKSINIPQRLTSEQHSHLLDLDRLSEHDRNKHFADLIVLEHQKAIQLFSNAANTEADPELKQFAAQHVAALQNHLAESKRVQTLMQNTYGGQDDQALSTGKSNSHL